MKPRRVRFTDTASSHVDRERTWWLKNRELPDLFATELEKTIEILALLPGAGALTGSPACRTYGVFTSGSSAATCITPSTQTRSSFGPCGARAVSAVRRFDSFQSLHFVRLTTCRSAASGALDAHARPTGPPLVGGSCLLGGMATNPLEAILDPVTGLVIFLNRQGALQHRFQVVHARGIASQRLRYRPTNPRV